MLRPIEMVWVLLLASKFAAPREVKQSLIEVEIIFGCWIEDEAPIEILNTCATFSSFVSGRRGSCSYLWGLIFLLRTPLSMVFWEFMGGWKTFDYVC